MMPRRFLFNEALGVPLSRPAKFAFGAHLFAFTMLSFNCLIQTIGLLVAPSISGVLFWLSALVVFWLLWILKDDRFLTTVAYLWWSWRCDSVILMEAQYTEEVFYWLRENVVSRYRLIFIRVDNGIWGGANAVMLFFHAPNDALMFKMRWT